MVFFFNDTATTEIYTLSLHDALPICYKGLKERYDIIDDTLNDRLEYELNVIKNMGYVDYFLIVWDFIRFAMEKDRKSTRLNSSHANISYAVFCLKKKIPHALFPLFFF